MDEKLTDETLTREQAMEVAREAGETGVEEVRQQGRQAIRRAQPPLIPAPPRRSWRGAPATRQARRATCCIARASAPANI